MMIGCGKKAWLMVMIIGSVGQQCWAAQKPTSSDIDNFFACCGELGDLNCVSRLSGNVDVNMLSQGNKVTGLMLAAKHGRKDIVRFLLDKGAKVYLRDYNGRTALRWAMAGETTSQADKLEIITMMVNKDSSDAKALSEAATRAQERGLSEIAEYLRSKEEPVVFLDKPILIDRLIEEISKYAGKYPEKNPTPAQFRAIDNAHGCTATHSRLPRKGKELFRYLEQRSRLINLNDKTPAVSVSLDKCKSALKSLLDGLEISKNHPDRELLKIMPKKPQATEEKKEAAQPVSNEWACPMCTYLNTAQAATCAVCGVQK